MGAVPGSVLAGHTWSPPDVQASVDFLATTHGGPVTPSPEVRLDAKQALRKIMRQRRRDHVASLPDGLRALILNRPPAAIAAMAPAGATIGLYHPVAAEAPALGWARWFAEQGHPVALPWFAGRDAAMAFRIWANPWDEGLLEPAPFGGMQPAGDAAEAAPALVVVPLVAFTDRGERLGQGGGHYDRWLAANPQAIAIGLAWDCQQADSLPTEPHDRLLRAVVTPTRIHERHA